MSFEKTVRALTESLLDERRPPGNEQDASERDDAASYVLEQYARMPDYLRPALWLATLLFSLWTVPFTGRVFSSLSNERRARQVVRWRGSSLALRRNLIRFYESLTVYAAWSRRFPNG